MDLCTRDEGIPCAALFLPIVKVKFFFFFGWTNIALENRSGNVDGYQERVENRSGFFPFGKLCSALAVKKKKKQTRRPICHREVLRVHAYLLEIRNLILLTG